MNGRKDRGRFSRFIRSMSVQCLCSGDQTDTMDRAIQLSENIDIEDGMTSRHSSPKLVAGRHVNNVGMEETELSLQGGGSLNYEVGAPFYGINILVRKNLRNSNCQDDK